MRNKAELDDYEPVTSSRRPRNFGKSEPEDDSLPLRALEAATQIRSQVAPRVMTTAESDVHVPTPSRQRQALDHVARNQPIATNTSLKRGHSASYLGLFVFTFLVYFRPYELFPALAWMSKGALVVAVFTLAIFIPSQLGLENRISATPRALKLALALLVTGLLSIPLALEPSRAFLSLVEFFKVIVMFVVLVNVVRNEKRLRSLMVLVLVASCVLSIAAFSDYANGNLVLKGRRIAGLIGGLFSNPNDLALHLVTMMPIALALFLSSRGRPIQRALYLVCSLVLLAGLVATFSRGGFLALVCVVAFLGWKLARRNRALVGVFALGLILAALALAPGAYRSRLATTGDDSAVARTDDLKRSIVVATRHPFFGVGMDNYILFSNMNKATHNAYTQVASEMGFAALLIYVSFLFAPFAGLRRLERAAGTTKRKPAAYYLAIGLQAGLVGYMVASFFASVAYLWYVYYLVGYAICLQRIHSSVPVDSVANANLNSRSDLSLPQLRYAPLGFSEDLPREAN
ncbi:MAG: hypothetical protein QOD33_1366 [Pyrinomonadaceae bacterium]|nr:hypothetical protein [Pyrinomonadaceae bacterium]